jgi:small subunit ribosomal protein S17
MIMKSESISSRTLTGNVISDRMDKTVTVLVERRVKHPVYGKILTKSSKIKAHDDSNSVKEGDRVVIAECRPISKEKSWTVIKVENEKSGS